MITSLTTIAVAFITAILGPLLVEIIRNRLTSTNKISTMKEAIDLNTLVDLQLDNMMEVLECDRIWVAQFHNGGHFYPTGKSIQKFSLFYEKVSSNASSIQHVFQNIPVSIFPKALSKLYKDGELSIVNYSDDNNYDLNSFTVESNTKSFYMIAIDDLNNHFIGIMGISFNDTEHKLSAEEWIFIRQKIGAIGSLLTEYLNGKK